MSGCILGSAHETLETSKLLETGSGARRGVQYSTVQYSIVQYSTVQYDVKNVTEKGREGKKGRRGPGSVFYLDI